MSLASAAKMGAGYGLGSRMESKRRLLSILTGALLCAGATVAGATGASASGNVTVILTAVGPVNPFAAVANVGGTVLTQYSIIDGVEASVPAIAVSLLSSIPGLTVTPDVTVTVDSTTVSTGPHTPSDAFLQQTGASALATQGDSGQGVTVAVLDTGIDNLPDFAGRLIGGVDLTGEGNPFHDDFGHGTFVAGLVAGDGASSAGHYSGEAPSANLVAIKVAGASGQTDLATVISGVQWAVANESVYNIRVLNMSLGFDPMESTLLDPVDMAVEAAWNSGIAVVTSAGNSGPFNGTIVAPGDDPLVITVGALDDMAQGNVANDEMNDFSGVGPTNPDGWAKPDLVTSGRSVVSLAAPGSTIYNSYPSARIGTGNFVGSGTSFSSAITSGAAALLLEQYPNLTPNQVKARLLGTTNPGPVGNPFVDGHGALNVAAAVASGPLNLYQSTVGAIAAAVGATVSLAPASPANSWNAAIWTGAQWNGAQWNGAQWNGAQWNGAQWNGAQWNGFTWSGAQWNGAQWNGAQWNGAQWNGSSWTGAQWNGAQWNGSSWNGAQWNGAQWNGAQWNGAQWNGAQWNGAQWN